MRVEHAVAVALFLDLGFEKAGSYSDEKMVGRLRELPEKVAAADVKGEFLKLYEDLTALKKGDVIEIVHEAPAPDAKPGKKGKSSVQAAKEEKAGKKAAAPAAKKPAKAKVPKKEKEKKPDVPRDAFGAGEGTLRAALNAAVTKDWKTDHELVKESGVQLRATRIRLRRLRKQGLVERQRLIQYRWTEQGLKQLKGSK